jgi:protein-disulfide isomerase
MEHEHKEHHSGAGAESVGGGANFLPISILVAGVMISGSILYAMNKGPASPKAEAPTGGAPTGAAPTVDRGALLAIQERDVILGDPKAKVTIIEYGDYQCPFCVRFFEQTEQQIIEEYVKTGKAKFIFRDLAFLGPESVEAGEAAECAKDQGKFWVFHDALYTAEGKDGQEHNGNLNRELFMQIAGQVGMNTTQFGECYDTNKYAQAVQDVVKAAQSNGVNATPTSFVNDQMIQGAQPFAAFKTAIDAALAK